LHALRRRKSDGPVSGNELGEANDNTGSRPDSQSGELAACMPSELMTPVC
jgi:hypothetical protein